MALIAGLRLARNRLSRNQLTPPSSPICKIKPARCSRNSELAHGIHPPVLSDNGLVAAAGVSGREVSHPVQILADDDLRAEQFPEDVEGTAAS